MLTNGAVTLYHYRESDGGYDRVLIPECFWMDTRGASISTGRIAAEAAVTVYIPEAHASDITVQRDILVRGDCPHAFDNASAATISASLAALRGAYDIVTAVRVSDKRYGHTCRHIEVTAV